MVTGDGGPAGVDGVLSAEPDAADVVEPMHAETFLILPNPNVLDNLRAKSQD